MKRPATRFVALALSLLVLACLTAPAFALPRSPQVPVLGGSLQGYLNSVGESINVLTDQNSVQTWSTTVSNNSTFTLQIELAGNAPTNAIGIYNAGDVAPALYQVFPGAATNGWFATASFRASPARVVINLFDDLAGFQGSTTYLGANKDNFGYYLQNPTVLFYTQDARNPGGTAQALAFAGTGANFGQWWLCWEDLQVGGGSDQDYEDAVLFLESVNPTPVSTTSWGQLKARFR
jgi:hypothetical protein